MRNLIITLIIILPIVFIGCNDDIIPTENNLAIEEISPSPIIVDSTLGFTVKVHDNTLCFDSAQDVLSALSVLHKMPSAERRKWEASVGFTSTQTLLEDLQSEIEKLDDEDDLNKLLQENSELVIESPNDSYGIKPRVYGNYPCITGDKGFFVSESVWCKVFDGKLYSTKTFDHEGYLLMSKLSEDKDLSASKVQAITVDFNWENNLLKSYNHDSYISDTKIVLCQFDHAINQPTRKSIFTMELMNNYTTRTLSETITCKTYYLDVSYNGACDYCNPYNYSITYAGNYYTFKKIGYKRFRIQLPYANYSFSAPNWDAEYEWFAKSTENWYTYFGSIDIQCNFQAQKKRALNNNFYNWSNTVIWFYDVTAKVKVGEDVYYKSMSKYIDVRPLHGNYGEKNKTGKADDFDHICQFPISLYQNTPPCKFTGCVSGILHSDFCPYDYNFSFDF